MTFPRLGRADDVVTWAGKMVRALEQRLLAPAPAVILDLEVIPAAGLPPPQRPGQLVCVQDGTHGTLLLQSTSDGEWIRVDDRSEYPPP